MTNHQFLERIVFLTTKMSDIYNAEPLDQGARLAVLDEIHVLGQKFNRSRRRRSKFMILLLWISLGALAGLIIRILWFS